MCQSKSKEHDKISIMFHTLLLWYGTIPRNEWIINSYKYLAYIIEVLAKLISKI